MSDADDAGNGLDEPEVGPPAESAPPPGITPASATDTTSTSSAAAPARSKVADAGDGRRLVSARSAGALQAGAATTTAARRSMGSRRIRRTFRVPRTYVTSLARGAYSRQSFSEVETYCMFIGYSRSGHSLLGSLVDAHPDAVIAHELDAMRLFHLGYSRRQVYWLILQKERQFALAGCRAKDDHDYAVPNQWQGRYRQLRVIGHKKGALSTRRLGAYPALLDRVRRTVATRLRVIHVVRNPYDNIASMYRRKAGRSSLDERVDYYFSLCRTVADVKQRLQPDEVIDVRHEDVVSDPKSSLIRLGTFLGLHMSDDYIKDCASVLFPAPRRTRDGSPWTDALVTHVGREATRFDFLRGYTFDS